MPGAPQVDGPDAAVYGALTEGYDMANHGSIAATHQAALPDEFVEHGDVAKLMALCGLDAAGIEASIVKRFVVKPAVVARAVG